MGNYSEVPIGVALIVCDTIIEDKFTNKKSLVGLFGQIHAVRLPCVIPSISLLVSLTGGTGDYPCEIVCQHVTIDAPVFTLSRKIHFESPLQVLDLVFQLKSVRFPFPDQYWVKVLIDGVPIMMRPLTVIQKPPADAAGTTPQEHQPPKE